jgi:hypothetical protein
MYLYALNNIQNFPLQHKTSVRLIISWIDNLYHIHTLSTPIHLIRNLTVHHIGAPAGNNVTNAVKMWERTLIVRIAEQALQNFGILVIHKARVTRTGCQSVACAVCKLALEVIVVRTAKTEQ